MKDTIEKLDKLPDVALSDISTNTETIGSSESSGVSAVGKNEVISGGEHTRVDPLSGAPIVPGDTNPQPNGETAVKAPVITPGGGTKAVAIGALFTGKASVEIIDTVLPALFVLAIEFIGYEIDKKGLQLTAKEKETIAPFAQAYLDSLNVQMSPLGALVAVVLGVYSAKFAESWSTIKKKARAKQAPQEITPANPEKVLEQMKKTQEQQERNKKYALFVLPMTREAAIAHIKTTKRMSAEVAGKWYDRNVKPLKKK